MIKRCSKCILPETIPNITFDDKGVCNYCIEFDKNQGNVTVDYDKRKKRFETLMNEAQSKKIRNRSKYDALVPLSGGRDSSYVAMEMSKDFKILCVNYDNPFSSSQARMNIENLMKKINADLITFKYPRERHERSFRTNLRAWLKNPQLAPMGLLCLACKPMYLEFFKIAKMKGI